MFLLYLSCYPMVIKLKEMFLKVRVPGFAPAHVWCHTCRLGLAHTLQFWQLELSGAVTHTCTASRMKEHTLPSGSNPMLHAS